MYMIGSQFHFGRCKAYHLLQVVALVFEVGVLLDYGQNSCITMLIALLLWPLHFETDRLLLHIVNHFLDVKL